MIDLERLITEKQDALRGRPEDWIDRFCDWRNRIDWVTVVVIALVASPALVIAVLLLR